MVRHCQASRGKAFMRWRTVKTRSPGA